MAGICFYFESSDVDVWSGKDLDAWNYACKIAGDIDSMIVIDKTGNVPQSPDKSMTYNVAADLGAALTLMTGSITYVACPWDNAVTMTNIKDFDHNTDWYVFGPASGWKSYAIQDAIFMAQAGEAACHSVHAATAVMFDRYQTWQ